MFLRVLAGFVVFFACTLAWAQKLPSIELFGGYSYTPTNFAWIGRGESGWNAVLTLKTYKWIGFTSDFAQYRSTYTFDCPCPSDHSTVTTFLFGPRVAVPLPDTTRIVPFAHYLFGGSHASYKVGGFTNGSALDTTPAFAWAAGGGMDVRLTGPLAIRGEADYLHTKIMTSDNQLQSRIINGRVRISTGVVLHF